MTQTTSPKIGDNVPRYDGRLKVTGEAQYGTDYSLSNPAYAYLATSPIALGRITSIDESEARSLPGVLDILTYKNVGALIKPGKAALLEGNDQGFVASTMAPLYSERIHYGGQIVAMVVAETFETARDASNRLQITYAEERPSASFDSPGAVMQTAASASTAHKDPHVGDAASAYQSAAVKIDARYETPTQHHNPLELFTTTCAWSQGQLTIWEPSQNVYGIKCGVADQIGIAPEDVRVISRYVGGAFGSRGFLMPRTSIVALAAKRVKRPVRLEPSRDQCFSIQTYRAETRHHMKLGAGHDGKLQSLTHEAWEVTCRPDPFVVAGTEATTRLYACPNINSIVNMVHADRNTPGYMRGPPETPYLFPLESAMDELAYALKMDPIELRRINDTQHEPIEGLPYSSRHLMECFDAASATFGWSKRTPEPGSMRDGDWLIGMGCASSMYPTQVAPASARVSMTQDGHVKVQTATHAQGNGVHTVIALTAGDLLGVAIENIQVEVGDTILVPAPVTGGSNSTASVCNVVAKACRQIRDRLIQSAIGDATSPFAGLDAATLKMVDEQLMAGNGVSEPLRVVIARAAHGSLIEAYAENMPDGSPPDGLTKLYQGRARWGSLKDRIQYAFGAQFIEVRVHERTREVRVARAVGAYAAGRIVSQRTAESQLMGGLIWGISAALHESTEMDMRSARYYNNDLAEYLIPVNADIKDITIIMLPEIDHQVNELGIKGIGELGNVGMNAAVANAVFHATGKRVRQLPIRIEKLI